MRRLELFFAFLALFAAVAWASFTFAFPISPIVGGGTGTSTVPTFGRFLIGGNNSEYEFIATSSLNLKVSSFISSAVSQWTNDIGYLTSVPWPWTITNYGESTSTVTGFTSGLIAASSTISSLSVSNGTTTNATSTNISTTNASTTNLFISGLRGVLLGTDMTGKVGATSTIGTNLLSSNSVTVNTTYPLAGGAAVPLGSSVTLTTAATSTFSAPLVFTANTNAVTCTSASNGVTGCMSAIDWSLLHSATTTFASPLIYTVGTNQVTFSGLATTSTFTQGQALYATGAGTVASTPTTSVTCTGATTCTGFTVFGSSPITISSTAGGGGGTGGWAFGAGYITNSTSTDQVLVDESATTTAAKLEVNGLAAFKGFLSTASSTVTSGQFTALYASTTNLTISSAGTLWMPGISSSNLLYAGGTNNIIGVATSSLSASSPLTGSLTQIGSGGSLGIQAASAVQNGYESSFEWQLLHTATTTFSYPLSYSVPTNAVTVAATSSYASPLLFTANTNQVSIQAASASQNGYESQNEFNYVHTATTTFSAPLVYTQGTNAVTCTSASNGVTGCMTANDWGLLHTATTTFASPLVYTASTNQVTCPTCGAGGGGGGGWTFIKAGIYNSTTTDQVLIDETSTSSNAKLEVNGLANFLQNASTTLLSVSNGVSTSTLSGTGLSINSWAIASTTWACATNCQFKDPQSAINAGYNVIFLKDETYVTSAPITIPRDGISIIGQGRNTVIQFSSVNGAGLEDSNPATRRFYFTVSGMLFSQSGGGSNTGTCVDFSSFSLSTFDHIYTFSCNLGLIASTTGTLYNTISNSSVQVGGTNAIAFQDRNLANLNTFFDDRAIVPNATDSTGFSFDAHSIHCDGFCDTETGAGVGVDIGPNASDFNGELYLEANRTNLRLAAGVTQVNVRGYNVDATVANITDNGAIGFVNQMDMQRGPSNYITGANFSVGTTTPFWNLTSASTSGPQIGFTDGNPTDFAWTERSINNNYYLASSTAFATSTTPSLFINGATGAFTFNAGATSTFGAGINTTAINETGNSTSTFNNGINVAGGCFSVNGTCVGGGGGVGTVTAVSGTWPIVSSGGNTPSITWNGLSTTTNLTAGQIVYASGAGSITSAATGTVSGSGPITATAAQSIIGSGLTIGCTSASNGVTGCMSAIDWSLLHSATTTFSAPLSYSVGTNAVTLSTVPVATGGTATTTQITNGVNFFDGTEISSVPNFAYINNYGLGVGTSTPIHPLDLATSTGGQVTMIQLASTIGQATEEPSIDFRDLGGAAKRLFARISAIGGGSFANSALKFSVDNGNGSITERMRIDKSGDVAIGTTTPFWSLTAASSTGPQMAICDGSITTFCWTQRAINNNYYLATSTPLATSTTAAIAINGTTGAFTFNGGATSTFNTGLQATNLNLIGSTATNTAASGFNISGGCFAINGTCVGGGTVGSSASSTLLSDNNMFSGTETFTKPITLFDNGTATATLLTLSGRQLLNASSSDPGGTAGANFFFGLDSGSNITSGYDNTGFGFGALRAAKTNVHNTAVGYDSMFSSQSGVDDTGVGYAALYSNTNGSDDTAFGYQALVTNSSGGNNTSMGYSSLSTNSTGSYNSAYGEDALLSNDTGTKNSGYGMNSLYSNVSGTGNVGIGYQAGYDISSGYDNIFIGHTENTGGNDITTGGGDLGIGYNIVFPSTATNNMLNIGNFIFAKLPATTTSTSLPSSFSGAMGIGTTSPAWSLTAASSTGPQIAACDTNGADYCWTQRSINNNWYLATSTQIATSTTPALTLNANGWAGFATSSPGSPLSINNIANFSAATSTFYDGVQINGGLNLASGITGFLKAVSGVVTTALVNLSSDVTGTLPAGNGGTGATSLSGAFAVNSNVLGNIVYPSFTVATSTTWTGTTTIPLGTAFTAQTINAVQCYTDVGTVNVDFYYNGATHLALVNASTTIGTFSWTINNTPSAGQTFKVDIGTPASSPHSVSCTVKKTI